MKHPLERELPKWPQMLVRGEPMKVEQAREIIRRTDSFFSSQGMSGNDRHYADRVMREVGMPERLRSEADWTRHERWLKRWGFIPTEYVRNEWISCAFIGGPHGWCHPDGTVGFDDNVGKWPDNEAVMNDWLLLSREFPWIDLTVVMMDRESCEEGMLPICGFRVSGGDVAVFDPCTEGPTRDFRPKRGESLASILEMPRREQGIDWSWIKHWGKVNKELAERE